MSWQPVMRCNDLCRPRSRSAQMNPLKEQLNNLGNTLGFLPRLKASVLQKNWMVGGGMETPSLLTLFPRQGLRLNVSVTFRKLLSDFHSQGVGSWETIISVSEFLWGDSFPPRWNTKPHSNQTVVEPPLLPSAVIDSSRNVTAALGGLFSNTTIWDCTWTEMTY